MAPDPATLYEGVSSVVARQSAQPVSIAAPASISVGRGSAPVDVVLTWRAGRLVVTPRAGLGGDALYALLLALAGIVRSVLILDLTQVFPTEAVLVAVRDALLGSAEQGCAVCLVDERPGARRRAGRLRGGRAIPIYASVESAIGAA